MTETCFTADDSVVRFDRDANESDGRSIIVRLVRWGEVANTPQGRESFARGAFEGVNASDIHIESMAHDGPIVGRGEFIEDAEDGAYLRARISETSDGNDLLTLVGDGTMDRASISFIPSESKRAADGTLVRTKATIRRLAVLPRGAYPSSQVLAVRNEPVTDSATTEPVATPVAPPVPAQPPFDAQPILDRVESVETVVARLEAQGVQTTEDPMQTDRRSIYDVLAVTRDDPEAAAALNRALADNVTADNDGLIKAGHYIGRIIGPIREVRSAVGAFGGPAGLPDAGMSFEYIEFDKVGSTGHEALVAKQTAEKAEVNTGTHGWDQKSIPIDTYAGGSDVSWQLLRRSSPAYRNLLVERYASEYAFKTEAEFCAALEAGGTPDAFSLGTDSTTLMAALFDYSMAVKAEVGQAATVVLAADDVFSAIGKLPDLVPPQYGTQNLPGITSAASLRINVSGLEIVNASHLAPGMMVVSHPQAASWHEDGPRIDTQDIPKVLGTDVVIWGFGAPAVYMPAAVIVATVTLV